MKPARPTPPRRLAGEPRAKGTAQLERERRRLPDDEREDTPARAAADDPLIRAARSGHDGLRGEILKHTETSPKLTSGDVDARWQDAYAIGDEAPGGDNLTPDQDRVDDIGRALGITYQDDQELEGGEEVASRDRHRWELDPASAEDWPHDEDRRDRDESDE
ncbi:MAG TPA: DUF6335 family protein [Vicinamibacterales bacterium]|nr:DUF6335 family protein [Vicinamibacterales bacterium]